MAQPGSSSVHVNSPKFKSRNKKKLEIEKGGPGSGVSGDNTEPIEMPHSPYTSVGTRKGMLENMAYSEEEVPMESITHAGQEKFVPKKLEKVVENWNSAKEKPVDLLKVNDEYHIIDGHHRYLAAKEMGENTIKANVRVKAGKIDKEEEAGDNSMDGIYSMQQIVSGIDYELGDNTGLLDVSDARNQVMENLDGDPDFYRKKRLMTKDTETNPSDGLGLTPGLNLDLGSGQCRWPGYLGVDLYKYDHGTIVDDLDMHLPWLDNESCEQIRMSNVPELSPLSDDMMMTMQRVLMPDGEFVYEGPGEIPSLPPHMQMTKKESVDKDGSKWVKQTFKKSAIPDAATSNDAEPRIGVAQYDMLSPDALLANDAVDYGWSDATSSGRGNRVHGYPSQGALLNKELPGFLGDDNTGAISKGGPGSGPQGGEHEKTTEEHEKNVADTKAKMEAAHAEYKKALTASKSAKSKADNAPDRAEKDPKSLRNANEKIRESNAKGDAYNKSIDEHHAAMKAHLDHLKSKLIGKSAFNKECSIFKADSYKQIVYCVVLSPDEADLQDDIMSAEDIEKAAHDYLVNARVVGAQHSKMTNGDVVESYIAPLDFSCDGQFGPQSIKKGAWIIGIKVNDPSEWQKVLSGEYTGVSVGGSGHRIPL